MITPKKLQGGGDIFLEAAIENSAVMGADLIELLWNNKNGVSRFSIAEVAGFKYPVVGNIQYGASSVEDGLWVEATLKFYPDGKGNCWGYVYDDPSGHNRRELRRSLINGWFRIVDKSVREQIVKEAEQEGLETKPRDKREIHIRVTEREKQAQNHAKVLERKLEETAEKMKKLQEDLAIAKNEKLVRQEKRLKGVKVPNRDAILNNENDKVEGE